MTTKYLPVSFRGRSDLYLAGTLESGGAIASRSVIESGYPAYAFLYPDGQIKRYLSCVGRLCDLSVIGEPTEISEGEISSMLLMTSLLGLQGVCAGDPYALYDKWEQQA